MTILDVCVNVQVTVGDLVGVSNSVASLAVRKVTRLIANLAPQYVKFPSTVPARSMTVHDFYAIAAFPGVLGAVDCTHVPIPIQSPGGNHAELFRSRKGYFSINVQAVASADLTFTNVVSRWHGSAHDARCHHLNAPILGQ